MSRTIDERIVTIRFDNTQFEKNIKTSINSLNEFEKASKLDGAETGIQNVEKAVQKFDMSPMSQATISVSESFNVLGRVATNVLSDIAIRAERAGEKILRSLTTEQIQSGYGKYEEKIASVQTLINSTGKSLDEINDRLDVLMRFSDETSYGFTEMASSLGQLASNGGDIDKLTPMIMGIANATAFAGKTAAEFRRAIFNLNQSYGHGFLELRDWRSLELAGVASKQLKESFIETGIELGRLNKDAKTLKGHVVDIGNFSETLKDGWADTEVMEQTFGKFYQYTQKADEMVAQGVVDTYTAAYREMLKSDASLSKDVYFRAAKAAQEATTFQQAIIATKDAVSSGWMRTFDTIFGDYDQARKTWSNLAEDLYTIFAAPVGGQNEILGGAFENGFTQVKKAFTEFGIWSEDYQNEFEKFLDSNGYKVDDLITQYGSLSAAIAAGADVGSWYGRSESVGTLFTKFTNQFLKDLDNSTNAVMSSEDALSSVQKLYDDIWNGSFGNGAERVQKLAEAGLDYATAQKLINDLAEKGHRGGYKLLAEDIANLTEEQRKGLGISSELAAEQTELANAIKLLEEDGIDPLSEEFMNLSDEELRNKGISDEVASSLRNLYKVINRKSGQVLLSETISNITQSIINLQEIIGNVWAEIFQYDMSEIIYRIVERVHDFTEGIKNATEAVKNGNGDFSLLRTILEGLVGIGKILSSVFGLVKEIVFQLVKGGINVLSKLFEGLNINVGELSTNFSDAIDKATDWLKDNQVITEAVENAAAAVDRVIGYVKNWLENIGALDQIKTIGSSLSKNIETLVKDGVNLDTITKLYKDTVDKIKNNATNPFEGVGTKLTEWVKNLGATADNFKTSFAEKMLTAWNGLKPTQEQIEEFTVIFKQFADTLLGIGGSYMALRMLNKFADSASALVAPIRAFSDVMASFAGVGYSLSKYINQKTQSQLVNNVLKIAVAVGILVGALYALAKLGDTRALWEAIGATAALLGIITTFAFLLSLISKDLSSNEKAKTNLKDLALVVGAFAAAILIIAGSMKLLDGIKLETWIGAALVFPILMVALTSAMKAMGGITGGISKGAIASIVAIALGIRLMVGAIKQLDEMDIKHPLRTFLYFVGIMGAIAGSMIALKGISTGAALPLISFALTLLACVKVLAMITKLTDETYVVGLLRLIPILGALALIITLSKGMKFPKESAMFLIGTAATVYLLAKSIEKLGNLKSDQLIRGGIAATALYIVIGSFGALISRMADLKYGSIKAAIGVSVIMVTAAASIYVMVGAILLFKNIPVADLFKAVGAIGVILAAIGGLLYAIGKSELFSGAIESDHFKQEASQAYQAVNALARIALIIGVAAVAIAALAFIAHYDFNALVAAVVGLSAVMLAMGGLIFAMSKISWNKQTLAGLGIMVVVLAAVGGVLYLLERMATDGGKMLQIAESLSLTMAALGLAMLEIAGAGAIATLASAQLPVLAAVVLGLTGILAAISELITKLGISPEELDAFVAISEKIGAAIGGFAGNLVGGAIGGVGQGITSTLPAIGQNLSDFAANIEPFLNLKIPEGFNETLSSLGSILSTFGGNIFNIGGMAMFNTKMEDIKKFFTGLGEAVTELSKASEGMNRSRVQVIAEVTSALAELSNSLGNTKSGIGWIFGGNKVNLSDFAGHLKSFGKGLVEFSNSLNGWNQFVILDKLPAIRELLNLEMDLGDTHSLLGFIIGQGQNLGDFGNHIKTFGAGLKSFSDSLHGFDTSTVVVAKSVGETFTELEKGLVASPNLMGYITGGENGNQSLQDFGMRIHNFALNLKAGLESLQELSEVGSPDLSNLENKGIPTSALEGMKSAARDSWFTNTKSMIGKMMDIAQEFSSLEGELVQSGSFSEGSAPMKAFGDSIKAFAIGMKGFSENLPDEIPDDTEVEKLINIGKLFKELGIGAGTLEESASGVNGVTNAISAFGTGVSNVWGMFTSGFNSLTSGEEGEGTGGGGFLSVLTSMFHNDTLTTEAAEGGTETATSYLTSIQEIFGEKSAPMKSAKLSFDTAAKTLMDYFVHVGGGKGRAYKDEYYDIGANYMQGLIEGIESKMSELEAAANRVAELIRLTTKDGLYENSPSKYAYTLGEFFVQGLVNGIDDMTETAADSALELANSVSYAVQSALDASSDIIEDSMSPLISPVLDTSNVRSGAQVINSMLSNKQTYDAVLGIESSRYAALQNQNGASTNPIININFNVDQVGGELTEEDISKYSRQIAEEVNYQLGMKLKGR